MTRLRQGSGSQEIYSAVSLQYADTENGVAVGSVCVTGCQPGRGEDLTNRGCLFDVIGCSYRPREVLRRLLISAAADDVSQPNLLS